jgi:cell fate regulator YaaT (PSP1 superfamily)
MADPQIVEVRFKGTRKGFYAWPRPDEPLRLNDHVVVEAERGHDLGRVSTTGERALAKCGIGGSGCSSCTTSPASPDGTGALPAEPAVEPATEAAPTDAAPAAPAIKPIVRRATQEDVRQHNELRRSEEDTRRRVIDRVRHHQLVMKVSDCEWQWDRNKLTIFFTAEKRVDFRALVRDLATQFRTRIELRQIGVRDEAARLGGVGRCGKEYCCSTWLTELSPVNLGLAKDQHLSLNPSQISGGCGRLLCCLKYEHEFYVAARRRFPKEGKALQTAQGAERVVAVDIFRERVFLRSEEHGSRIVSLVQLREEVERLGGVLPTAEQRAAAAAAQPAPVEPAAETADESGAVATASEERRSGRRRRRRPRGGSNGRPSPSED